MNKIFLLIIEICIISGTFVNISKSQTYLSESFEGTWSGTPSAPSGWSIIHTNATGGSSGTDPINWTKNTWSGSAWSFTGSCPPLNPAGAQNGNSVAWYNDNVAKATQKDQLTTGTINLSSSINPRVTFFFSLNLSGSATFKLKASSNGGASFDDVQIISKPGQYWTKISVTIPAAYKVANAKIGLEVTASWTAYDLWIDNFIIEETPPPLTGNKTIKLTGGDFSSFSDAINSLNIDGVGTGGVIFNVDAGFTSTELCPAITTTGTSSNPIIFQKSGSGINPKITAGTGLGTGDAIITLKGCDYVTFDGIDLMENSANLTTTTQMEFGFYIINNSATDGAQNNTIKNSKLTLNRNNTSTRGIYQFTLTTPTNQPTGNNNYNKYYNIIVENSYFGIYLQAISSTYYDIGCEIGVTQGGSTIIGAYTSNDIGNGSSAVYGIRASYQSGVKIFNTIIRNINCTSSSNRISGLFLENSYGISSIYNNLIMNVSSSSNTTTNNVNYLVSGMRLDVASGASVNVYNNLVYGIIYSPGSVTTALASSYTQISGIVMGVTAGTSNLYNNSIRIEASTNINSSCILNTGSCSNNITTLNNILANYTASQSGTPKHYIVMRQNSIGNLTNINYNDYFINNVSNGYTGYYTSDRITIADWRTATGQDAYSISGDPGFSSATDLSINVNSPNCWNINGKGDPTVGISFDIINNTRSTTIAGGACDIGAFEFTPVVAPNDAIYSPATIVENGTTDFTVAGNTILSITWHIGSGSLPTAVSVKYHSGETPSNIVPGANYANLNTIINVTGGSNFTYDMIYFYTPSLLGNITGESNTRFSKYDASTGWLQFSSSPNTINKNIAVTGLSSFSTFAFSDINTPLPVNILSFTSHIYGRNTELNWVTENEQNNTGFEIERKNIIENSYYKIGFIKSNGNSNSITKYSYIDSKLNSGKYNYRLKQLDINGNYNYYELDNVLEIALPSKYNLSQNYPNPFNPITKIDYGIPNESKVYLKIYDLLGREILNLINGDLQKAGYYTVQVNGNNLSSGVYFYRLITNVNGKENIITRKMNFIK